MFITPTQRLVTTSAILLIISGCSSNPSTVPEASDSNTRYDHTKRNNPAKLQVNRYQSAFIKAHAAGSDLPRVQLASYTPEQQQLRQQLIRQQQQLRLQRAQQQRAQLQRTRQQKLAQQRQHQRTQQYPVQTAWQQVHQGFRIANYNHKAKVRSYVASYSRMPERMQTLSQRAAPYLPTIMQEIRRRNMPSEIALLPFVESAFDNYAYSPAHAAGMWQFIPETARRYGLNVNSRHDERYNWKSSTNAALDYLQDLNREFNGDWLLSLAAYNCGEGRVQREITKNRARGLPTDFWHLNLPRETRNYVPRLLAFKEVFGNPQGRGMTIAHIPHNPRFESTQYKPSAIGFTPVAKAKSQTRKKVITHHVRSGDTLYSIAKKYDTSIKTIMNMNGLKSTRINSGERLIVASVRSSNNVG